MILRLPKNFLSPLAAFAFIGVSVDYVNSIFTTSTRWIFLALLILYLLAKGRLLIGLRSTFGIALAVYCVWCLTTYNWSEVPYLSIAKATAFSGVAVAFVSAGYWWVAERGTQSALSYFAPVSVLAIFAGSMGTSYNAASGAITLDMYQGLTYNPNMLGSLLAMALPFLLWNAYRYRATPQLKWVWFALLAIAAAMLVRSYSRSAIMAGGVVAFGFCLSLRLNRTAFISVLIGIALFVAAAVGTAVLDKTYQVYILKGGESENGILFSRQIVWQESYDAAVLGGRYGLGYGVSAGDFSFHGGLTTVGYGREKGNTQMAIIEETGLVGLGFYFCILLTLFIPLILAHRREKFGDNKVALGIVIGALGGFTAMSIFEAWWVAPGSPELVFFWSMAGIGLCLARSSVPARNPLSRRRIVTAQPIYSARFLQERRAKG